MIAGIDHIGLFVPDLDAALRFYTGVLGLRATPIEPRTDPPIRMAYVEVGAVRLELIEAADPELTMMRYLPRRAPGAYHLGVRVADVDTTFEALRSAGVATLGDVREGDHMRVAFLDPAAADGVLIELVTRKDRHA